MNNPELQKETATEQPVIPPVETTAPPVAQTVDISKLKTAAPYSKSFRDTVKAFPDNVEPTEENVRNYALKSGFNPDSFMEAGKRLNKEFESGGDGIPDRTAVGRVAG